MKKFIVIYRANASAMAEMGKGNPEDAKESMKPWMEWAEKCGSGLVDLGSPLGNAQVVNINRASAQESDVVGYSILQAETMDGAAEMLTAHPHLQWNVGCSIEVLECMPLPQ